MKAGYLSTCMSSIAACIHL